MEEGEFVDESAAAGDDESVEVDIMTGGDVEIAGLLVQPEPSSAHDGRDEAQQPGSPNIFISSLRAVDPSPTTG